MAVILGLNAHHADSAAAIVVDGKLVAAVEEERFRRVKHWAGFPAEAVRFCFEAAGVSLGDVTHVAVNSDPRANLLKKMAFVIKSRPELSQLLQRVQHRRERNAIEDDFTTAFGTSLRAELCRIEHHSAHLASAYLAGPFDRAIAVSVDGFGDFSSAAWGMAADGDIAIHGRVQFPHSLGQFYQAMTQLIGFPHYGDEYKVMGLAPYGEPRYRQQMRQVVLLQDDGTFELNLDYFRHATETVAYTWQGAPAAGTLYSEALVELLGPPRQENEPLEQRHKDLACSVQSTYEEALFHLLSRAHREQPCSNLVLAGGCALNSVANGKVTRATPFERLYVPPAAGDAGGAIGAALVTARRIGDLLAPAHLSHASLGPEYGVEAVSALLEERRAAIVAAGCSVTPFEADDALIGATVRAISDGLVVGWYQGRLEFGPRALGNRSIVCDPRRADMKEMLNRKIKRRETFRPFGPSVLREAVNDWFDVDDDAPFMTKVFPVREDKRAQIPAVTHIDGTARLHTVYRHTNPRYHALIKAFEEQTGVPMLLNTSFNENEPIVCRPEEALDCFLRTKMDILILGAVMLRRPNE